MQRTSPTQLPAYEELCQILSSEAKRAIPKEKEDLHFCDFSTIIDLLRSFSLPAAFFTENIKFEDWNSGDLFKKTVSMFDDLVSCVLSNQNDPEKQKLFNSLYDYLSEIDVPQKVDIIFVFGSKSTFRIEKAVDLYKKGFADKILISGRGPFYEKDTTSTSEAELLAEFALNQGVPEDVLILEKESITVPDNIKCSLNLLEKEDISHKSFILVNSPFSQRRGWGHFQKMSDVGTKFYRVNTETISKQFSRDGWYKDEAGAKVILKEFFGLRVSELINTM